MDTVVCVSALPGFEKEYKELAPNRYYYDDDDVLDALNKKYNIQFQYRPNPHSSVLSSMLCIDFKTEENMTMCMLKWS